ncbi:MAG: Ig-like domain-containing protein, partial [Plesiomonas sp.]
MINKSSISSVASIALLSLFLTACGGDGDDSGDNGFLDPMPESSSLTAYPQLFVLKQGQTQRVDLTQSVVANKIPSWEIASLSDKSGLGTISAQTTKAFSYSAQTPGIAQIDYSVQGGGKSANSNVIVAISPPLMPDNHNPQAQDVQLITFNNVSKTIDLQGKFSDVDNDPLTLALYGSPRFTLNGTQVTFAPNGFVGVDHAVYSVDDGDNGYALASIIAISEDANPSVPNKAPTAASKYIELDVTTTATLSFDLVEQQLIKDEDGDALTIKHLFTTSNRATIQGTTGIIYNPGAFRGVDHFTYVVTDGKGGYAANAITVAVSSSGLTNNKPNAAPVAAEMLHTDDLLEIPVSGVVNDPDDDELNLVSISGSLGQASISPKDPLTILYTPNNQLNGELTSFVGTDRFVYIISDDKGGYAMSEVTVTVSDSNPTPPEAKIVQEKTLV